MPEHTPPGGEPEIRPDVVQAVFSALIDMDPDKLTPLEAAGIRITPAEREQADKLYHASMLASMHQRERWLKAVQVLTSSRKLSEDTSWSDLFDSLGPEHASQLRELYDAMPDGARTEYDRRYGRPEEI
jgi:hypothetical protein